MPLFSQPIKKAEPPPATHWGEAKGRVRHIKILPDLFHAVYVIEEAPAWIEVKMKIGERSWSHRVFAPWRYYFIRVRHDGRVDGGNTGYLLYSLARLPDLTSYGLLEPIFPNVFDSGGICLGYTSTAFDRTPVRSAWRAIRLLYSIPGNQWLNYQMPRKIIHAPIKDPLCNSKHMRISTYDYTCAWAGCTEKQVMEADWNSVNRSIMDILSGKSWEYQTKNTWDEDTLNEKLREHGVTL